MEFWKVSENELERAPDLPAQWSETIPHTWRDHAPEWHGRMIEHGKPVAACSLWIKDASSLAGERLALLGHYADNNAVAGGTLLKRALAEAASRGATYAVGPMDGNTWRRYRWMDPATREARSPFFLEPVNPPAYPETWRRAGFTPQARYQSSIAQDLLPGDPRLAAELALPPEVQVRSFDPERFEADLRSIFDVSLASFTANHFYTPLAWSDFLKIYQPLREVLDPACVLLAFDPENVPVGFAFALPDMREMKRHGKVDTLIFKTVAVVPEWRHRGPGGWLFAEIHRRALEGGYRHVIHALSAVDNPVVRISARTTVVFRNYTLFGQRLRRA